MGMRRVLSRLSLVLLGTAAGLGVGECSLRMIGFEEEMARRSTVFDPRYGTVRADSWIFDFAVEPGQDAADLRGQRVPLEKDPDEVRILFVGDSGTEGVLIPLEQTYPSKLGQILDAERSGHPVRTVNAGVFGMTTIDELHFLESRLLPLEPDVVVVGLFMSNDINFNLGHVERLRTVAPPSSWGRDLVQGSALAHFVYVQGIALNARYHWFAADAVADESVVPRELALVDSYGFHMLSYPAGEVATYMREPSPLVAHAYDVLEQVLWRMKRLGERRGFALRVVLIPTPSTVSGRLTLLHYPNIREDLRARGVEVRDEDLDFDAPTRRVLSICEELAIPCFDPTDRMREIGMDVFFPDDEHPTALGHAVIAEELAAGYARLVPSR